MPTFLPADVSPVLLCALTVVLSVLAGMMPCSPFEPMLVAVAAVARPSLLIPLAVLATVSQMAAKTLLYVASRKAERSLSVRKRALFERVRARLAGRRWLQIATILVSGVFGLPPFYVVTVACGALRLPLRDYVVVGTFGRALRFTAIMMLPQLLAAA
jgi:membrane protein YqaA with SNARE-associated domain